jgi:hypothetical protein
MNRLYEGLEREVNRQGGGGLRIVILGNEKKEEDFRGEKEKEL